MTPMPVTTTRRIRKAGAARRAIVGVGCGFSLESVSSTSRHSFHHVADAADVLHFFVGNVDIELVFEREDDVDAVHRVDAQLFEAAVDGDLRRIFALGLGDDAQNALGQFVVCFSRA